MKVLLINGSPRKDGCTYTALNTVAQELQRNDIETEIMHIGTEPIRGCIGCGGCARNKNFRCVFDDAVNIGLKKAETSDGFVFGSPVHYAAAGGAMTSFLDRMFYAAGGKLMRNKAGACVVSCRRGGASAALDQLNKYLGISGMVQVNSNYWNMVHGSAPEDVLKDEEGIQTMRVLGADMAWVLKCIKAGASEGIEPPQREKKILTSFIR